MNATRSFAGGVTLAIAIALVVVPRDADLPGARKLGETEASVSASSSAPNRSGPATRLHATARRGSQSGASPSGTSTTLRARGALLLQPSEDRVAVVVAESRTALATRAPERRSAAAASRSAGEAEAAAAPQRASGYAVADAGLARELVPGVREWWRPKGDAIEHGLLLASPPPGEGEVAVAIDLDGALEAHPSAAGVALTDMRGRVRAHYEDLHVIDAGGRELPSRMEVRGREIALLFDDTGARYPIVVDPMLFGDEEKLVSPTARFSERAGSSVDASTDGSIVVVGLPDTSNADYSVLRHGSAVVFERISGTYQATATLFASDPLANDHFGNAVAIAGDGSRIAVGALDEDDATGTSTLGNGAVYLFVRSGSAWTQERKLLAFDKSSGAGFGSDVELDRDGSRLFVGAPDARTTIGTVTDYTGGVYVYTRSGSVWSLEQKNYPLDSVAEDFGEQVAIDPDGTHFVTGVWLHDDPTGVNIPNVGAAYVFSRAGTVWSQVQKLVAADAADGDRNGRSVALGGGGDVVALGAAARDDVPSGLLSTGSVYVFTRSAGVYSQTQRIDPPVIQAAGNFGSALTLDASGDRLVVGAPLYEAPSAPSGSGTTFVYERTAGAFGVPQILTASDALGGDAFGTTVVLSPDASTLAVGAPSDDANATTLDVGSVYVYGYRYHAPTCTAPTDCGGGPCVDGVCCDSSCGGGAPDDCMACSVALTGQLDGTCAPLRAALAASTVCRGSAGACDPEERCSAGQVACPVDVLAAAATTCRASAGSCDPPESCTGSDAACPPDVLAPMDTVCRSARGACDAEERCDGAAVDCPPDTLVPNGSLCRDVAGACDVAERCDGASVDCPADLVRPPGPCRVSVGACDREERCDGVGTSCPADLLEPIGVACRAAAGPCDVEEVCDGTDVACPADGLLDSSTVCRVSTGACDPEERCDGVDAACPGDAVEASGTVCRASAGDCDRAERCDGTNGACPGDRLADPGVVCRAANPGDVCDVEESCDGTTSECPADSFLPAGVVCRASAGACDVAERCDGSSGACPLDVLEAGGTVCRASAGACDVEERCDGSSPDCGSDERVLVGTVCRAARGVCDVEEQCDGVSDACPSDVVSDASTVCRPAAAGQACDLPDSCDGASADCPADDVAPIGALCRPAAGACDVAETCDGNSSVCPADALAPSATVCAAARGPCESDATCTGVDAACPPRALFPTSTVCRAGSGPCDVEEHCDGLRFACPADAFAWAGVVCRDVVAGASCDVAERCSGSDGACPADGFLPVGTPCREAVGVCDATERCDGGPTCPADALEPDGTPCDDGLVCSAVSACAAGLCRASVTLDCSDSDPCTIDACVEPTGCVRSPIPACMADAGVDAGGVDLGVLVDSGRDDTGTSPDADGVDAGRPMPVPGGCSCRTGAREPEDGPMCALLVAVASVLGARRRGKARR